MKDITQDNIRYLLPLKVAPLASKICAADGVSIAEAIRRIYRTATYCGLERESTKRWHESTPELYRDYLAGV